MNSLFDGAAASFLTLKGVRRFAMAAFTNKANKGIALLITVALLCGCGSISVTTGAKQLSRELVEKSLIKGKTTKAEVRALLGEPQSITSGSFANLPGVPAETWSYSKTFYRDTAEKSGLGGSFARYAVTGSLYDRVEVSVLIVTFDARGRVIGHMFSTSAAGAPR